MSYRSREIPSEYRCLKELYSTYISLFVLWFWDAVTSAACKFFSSQLECPAPIPSWLAWSLLGFMFIGIFRFVYRVYRDFYRGDLWVDRGQI